ncbi:MAG: cyclic nucleotide-binding domain-containing protein, partial [Bdellovibrionia bacterium]
GYMIHSRLLPFSPNYFYMPIHPHFLWADLFKKGKNDPNNLVHILKENVLFQNLTHRELTYLSGLVHERVYQPDEPIFQQNDRGLGVYVIAEGRVAIKSQSLRQEVLVTTLTAGSLFGEIALIEEESMRTASAIAMEKTVLIGFFKPDLVEIIERKPAMGVKILFQLATVLGQRLIETTHKITLMKAEQGLPPGPLSQ